MGIFDFLSDIFDGTDWDTEHANAVESWEKAVAQYNSYAKKLRYRYSMIKKHGQHINEHCQYIRESKATLKKLLCNESAMQLLSATERDYVTEYERHIAPIKNVTALPECKLDVRANATQWDTSAPSLEDGVAFVLAGPLGILLNRAPTGYDSIDVAEVLEAKANVVKEVGTLKRRIVAAAKKQAKLKEKEKICSVIQQKIDWYKANFYN